MNQRNLFAELSEGLEALDNARAGIGAAAVKESTM